MPLRIILNAIPEAYSEREWYELPKDGLVAKKVGKAYNRAKGDLQERLGTDRF